MHLCKRETGRGGGMRSARTGARAGVRPAYSVARSPRANVSVRPQRFASFLDIGELIGFVCIY
eukprot:scaffold193371_cov19-Tisochrysis_lutea.AAC.1